MNYTALRLRRRVREHSEGNNNGQMNHSVFCLTLPTVVTTPGMSPSLFRTRTCRHGLTPSTSTIVLPRYSVYIPGGVGRPWTSIRRPGVSGREDVKVSTIGSGRRFRSDAYRINVDLMLPALVAPMGTVPKKPQRRRPGNETCSLSTNRFWNRFAMM